MAAKIGWTHQMLTSVSLLKSKPFFTLALFRSFLAKTVLIRSKSVPFRIEGKLINGYFNIIYLALEREFILEDTGTRFAACIKYNKPSPDWRGL
jgi:hypothetical protein